MGPNATSKIRRAAAAVVLGAMLASQAGCVIGAAIGGMAESYRRSSTRVVPAEYTGLQGKSFAVVVSADRQIQASFPGLVNEMAAQITTRLVDQRNGVNASGFVPPRAVLEFQYSRPSWAALSFGEIADHFGVERLVVVEVYEFRLREPGNAYLWQGIAAARVGVVEADGIMGNDFAYVTDKSVDFPDNPGMGPEDISEEQVRSRLFGRLVDRVSWVFYDHDEPYYPDY